MLVLCWGCSIVHEVPCVGLGSRSTVLDYSSLCWGGAPSIPDAFITSFFYVFCEVALYNLMGFYRQMEKNHILSMQILF